MVKLQLYSTEERETMSGSSFWEVGETEGSSIRLPL